MPDVLYLPSAQAEPVRQTRIRGRLPRAVTSLKKERCHRDLQQYKLSQQIDSTLVDTVAAEICAWEFDAAERATLTRALAILGSKLRSPGAVFDSPMATKLFLSLHLGALCHEEFAVMFLDAGNRLIAFESLFRGTLTQTTVYRREVAIRALAHRAGAVILVHNHPSGNPRPSTADVALTNAVKDTMSLVDVRVLDHFVVSGLQCTSMAELGLV